jgi:hypothetical protein
VSTGAWTGSSKCTTSRQEATSRNSEGIATHLQPVATRQQRIKLHATVQCQVAFRLESHGRSMKPFTYSDRLLHQVTRGLRPHQARGLDDVNVSCLRLFKHFSVRFVSCEHEVTRPQVLMKDTASWYGRHLQIYWIIRRKELKIFVSRIFIFSGKC